MNRKLFRTALVGLAGALMLSPMAAAAQVELNNTVLSQNEGWIENGVSYVTLNALSREGDYTLTWDGNRAVLTGQGAELTAHPGALYVEVNGRALYVPGGVPVVEGRTALPLRVLEDALDGAVSWDDQAATARMDTRGAVAEGAAYGEEDLYWLSRIISAESRGESLLGQIAVGNVVLNRVQTTQFPNTIKGVVFDRKNGVQFEPVENRTIYNTPTPTSVLAAKLALEGADVVGDCLYFFAPALSKGTWIVNNRQYYTTIGCHRFYI